MSAKERVFIKGALLSFPSLDKPKEPMQGTTGKAKFQATFLLDKDNESVQRLKDAIKKVAEAAYGDKAAAILRQPDKIPLKEGDARENIPSGYEGRLYIAARSQYRPELRDADPRRIISDEMSIREKFVPGYKVNGYVDIFPYSVRAPNGAVMKSGIAAGLVSVQFAAVGEPFGGSSNPAASAYPDESGNAAGEYVPEDGGSDLPF